MKLNLRLFVLSCALIAVPGFAGAQAPAAPSAAPAPAASNCAPTQSTSQGIAPSGTTGAQRTEPLSDKLAKSDGVLCPPAGVDPAMRAPTPDVGNTPVIPPPGSPGGDPTIRPK
jgi:hypothetical protein